MKHGSMGGRKLSALRWAGGILVMATGLAGIGGAAHAASHTISVSPNPGISGRLVAVSGTGWAGYDSVNVSLVAGTASSFMCSVTADSGGTIPATSCVVPTFLAHGSYRLSASDTTATVSTAFAFIPGVTVNGVNGQPATRAAAGQQVGLTGSGFDASSAMKAKFNGVSVPLVPAATSSAIGQVTGTGFLVPAGTPPGQYPVTLTDQGKHVASAQLTVFKATLSASPTPGVSGRPVSISGSGWPSNDSLQAFLAVGTSANFVCSLSADSTGALAQSCVLPMFLPRAAYRLLVEDASMAVSVPLPINPGVVVLGASNQPALWAAAGQQVGLSGSGFDANSAMKAQFNGVSVPLIPAVTSSVSGQVSGTSFVVPAGTAPGQYPVTLADHGNHAASAQLTVFHATLSASPASGVSGRPIFMSGSGWPSSDSLQASLVAGTSASFFCSLSADSTGALAQSCVLPTFLPQADYALVVQDGELAVSVPLTLNPGIVTTGTNGVPLAQALPGTAMLLNGSGFAANSTIAKMTIGTHTITFSPAVVTNTSGSFSGAGFKVPSIPAGAYVITVKDASGNKATANFSVT